MKNILYFFLDKMHNKKPVITEESVNSSHYLTLSSSYSLDFWRCKYPVNDLMSFPVVMTFMVGAAWMVWGHTPTAPVKDEVCEKSKTKGKTKLLLVYVIEI